MLCCPPTRGHAAPHRMNEALSSAVPPKSVYYLADLANMMKNGIIMLSLRTRVSCTFVHYFDQRMNIHPPFVHRDSLPVRFTSDSLFKHAIESIHQSSINRQSLALRFRDIIRQVVTKNKTPIINYCLFGLDPLLCGRYPAATTPST